MVLSDGPLLNSTHVHPEPNVIEAPGGSLSDAMQIVCWSDSQHRTDSVVEDADRLDSYSS